MLQCNKENHKQRKYYILKGIDVTKTHQNAQIYDDKTCQALKYLGGDKIRRDYHLDGLQNPHALQKVGVLKCVCADILKCKGLSLVQRFVQEKLKKKHFFLITAKPLLSNATEIKKIPNNFTFFETQTGTVFGEQQRLPFDWTDLLR